MKNRNRGEFNAALRVRGKLLAALAAGVLMGITLSASSAEQSTEPRGENIATMCGTKPTIVGLSDGYGGNTWRKTVLAELKDELKACPNITKILYTNANGDQQKAISDINSLVAQGVNVLLVYPDFGPAELPAMRAAVKAGAAVVPYLAKLDGTAGTDYTANVSHDITKMGRAWADWIGKTIKTGNVVFLGGIPGAPSSQSFLNEFVAGLKAYPDIKLLDQNYIVTNWNPADAQKAVSGLIAKYPKVDAIVSDYGAIALAAIKTYEQAGLPVPAQATVATNNELNCKYLSAKAAGKGFPYMAFDGSTTIVRFAVRRALSAYQGTSDNESNEVMPYPYADSAAGIDPKCDPGAPPDADFSGLLSQDQLDALFKQ